MAVLAFAYAFWNGGFTEESARLNIRWSARFSIVCFCIAFTASSLRIILPSTITHWLAANRKYFGISFAFIHLIHLLFLFLLHKYFHQVFTERPIGEIALGGLAYLFLVLMLITSFDRYAKLLSKKNWILLHTIGGYWILLVFSNSIIGRVVGGQMAYLPFGILVLVVWLVRVMAWRRKRVQ